MSNNDNIAIQEACSVMLSARSAIRSLADLDAQNYAMRAALAMADGSGPVVMGGWKQLYDKLAAAVMKLNSIAPQENA